MAGVDEKNPLDASAISAFPANERSSRAAIQALFDGLTGTGDLISTNNLSDVTSASTSFSNIKQAATASTTGVVELATSAESITGSDTTKAVTPDGLNDVFKSPPALGATVASTGNFTRVNSLNTEQNSPSISINTTNASFATNVISSKTTRTNNSAFDFFEAQSNSGADVEIRLSGDGNGTCDGSWTGGGADYAEYFEWGDGNDSNEDRRGFVISLKGEKIQLAQPGDDIIGVISASAGFVGNAAEFKWQGKYEVDEYGATKRDDKGDRILSSNFDSSVVYVSRKDRNEWGLVGLMGRLAIRKGQPTDPRWIKLCDLPGMLEEWLVR